MMKGRIFLTGLCLFIFGAASAQKIEATAGFLSDSLKIGEKAGFYLSVRYPSEFTILFPDSSFSYFPFEYESKRYFATTSANGESLDSAIYYLTTFEVDRIQTLSLPAYVVQRKDCTAVQSNTDSIRIIQLVAHVPDSMPAEQLPLKETLAYQKVFSEFNYLIFSIVTGIFIFLAVVAFLVFGKRIRAYFKKKKLLKNHSRFQEAYATSLKQLHSAFSVPVTESALVVWKKYMEQLEAKPYTKLTTREVVLLEKDDALGKNLKSVDGALYGHNSSVLESLENLKGFADQRFHKKLEEVSHAK